MGDAGGSGSHEPGPPATAEELERLRRRLYARSSSSAALDEYLGVEAELGSRTPPPVEVGPAGERPLDAPQASARPHRWRVTAAVICCLTVIALFAGWSSWRSAHPPLPSRIAPPSAPGRTLLFHSRPENSLSAPDKVTFEPADERMLFFAEGRRLVIVLRCVGHGSVRITAAEQRFDFRCDDRLRTTTRFSAGLVRRPFLILGRTTGDVVWGLRISSVPSGS